jgi:hypothetical protein
LDCEISFSTCNLACERDFTVLQAKIGNGADCPAAEPCEAGVDECTGNYLEKIIVLAIKSKLY